MSYPLSCLKNSRSLRAKFGLDRPGKGSFLYADVAARGQVGNDEYPWEQLDSVELFKALK